MSFPNVVVVMGATSDDYVLEALVRNLLPYAVKTLAWTFNVE